MDLLYDAAVAWNRLLQDRYEITYGKNKKLHTIVLEFQTGEFYHLAGFPHARDIQLPRFNQSKVLKKILEGKITEKMLAKSRNYSAMILPRLQAIIHMENSLDHDFFLYSYRRDLYPFYTSIKADFLLSYHSDEIYFMFIIKNGSISVQSFDFTFVSAFSADSRNYEMNQRRRTILKKTKTNLLSGNSMVIYLSDHLKEDK